MIKIEITLDDKGQVHVFGPVKDKILFFGLLKMAEIAVLGSEDQPRIQVPDIKVGLKDLKKGIPR